MTEEEKFENLISKKIGFMDITETIVRQIRLSALKPLHI